MIEELEQQRAQRESRRLREGAPAQSRRHRRRTAIRSFSSSRSRSPTPKRTSLRCGRRSTSYEAPVRAIEDIGAPRPAGRGRIRAAQPRLRRPEEDLRDAACTARGRDHGRRRAGHGRDPVPRHRSAARVAGSGAADARRSLLAMAFAISLLRRVGGELRRQRGAADVPRRARAARRGGSGRSSGMVSMLPAKRSTRLARRRAYLFAGGLGGLLASFAAVFAFALLIGRVA